MITNKCNGRYKHTIGLWHQYPWGRDWWCDFPDQWVPVRRHIYGFSWQLLVVALNKEKFKCFLYWKPNTYKILSQVTKFSRDKNGTKHIKNISFDILSWCPRYQRPLLFFCKCTKLLRDKRMESPKSFICSTFICSFVPTMLLLDNKDSVPKHSFCLHHQTQWLCSSF